MRGIMPQETSMRTFNLNSDLKQDILRTVACSIQPLSNDAIAYKLGRSIRRVQEATKHLADNNELQRARLAGKPVFFLSAPAVTEPTQQRAEAATAAA